MKQSFIFLVLWLLVGCVPTGSTPATTDLAPTARLTLPAVRPSTATAMRPLTATITSAPTETPTATEAITPRFWTPGPTPTAIQATLQPGECVVSPKLSGRKIDLRSVGSTRCLVWADEFDHETGFRVMLQFGYNGPVSFYDVPANTTGMPIPPILLEPLGQSFEYCMDHKDFQLDLYVLQPGQEPVIVTGMAAALECNRFEMPSSTPTPSPPNPNNF